jgi:hypothetical protein
MAPNGGGGIIAAPVRPGNRRRDSRMQAQVPRGTAENHRVGSTERNGIGMADHRHRPRKNTPHNVKVVDEENGRVMGRVVDITADGMMLVTNQEVTPGRQFQIRITLPVMVHHRSDVSLEARAVWCNQDTNPSFYKVGFKFLNMPGEEGFLLEDVMHRLNLVG